VCTVVKRKPIKMPKWKCVFTENLKTEYPFINENQHAGKVFCTICKSLFSIEHWGRSDILQHKKIDCCEQYELQSECNVLFHPGNNNRWGQTHSSRTFHTIKHNHYFPSMDCTSSVIRNLHVQKFSCGRTKCEATVVNVLAPFAVQQILEEQETAKYISVMVDTSNHKSLK
jgi:hypothetical protein